MRGSRLARGIAIATTTFGVMGCASPAVVTTLTTTTASDISLLASYMGDFAAASTAIARDEAQLVMGVDAIATAQFQAFAIRKVAMERAGDAATLHVAKDLEVISASLAELDATAVARRDALAARLAAGRAKLVVPAGSLGGAAKALATLEAPYDFKESLAFYYGFAEGVASDVQDQRKKAKDAASAAAAGGQALEEKASTP